MQVLDWIVLVVSIIGIVLYGTLRFRKAASINTYYKADQKDSWLTIGLSVMATQASAVTFLSTPGQGYSDGLGFIQFYFGMPLALIFICVFFLPRYIKSNVFTAYEILETRLGLKVRLLTAFLFLLQRGAGAGITILAPSLIMSLVLGWDLHTTVFIIGTAVVIYTVNGGSPAVNNTNKLQMMIILSGLVVALVVILLKLPANFGFVDSLKLAGVADKMKAVNLKFDIRERYNIWSGLAGGFFLALAYFGTDQSQVQRYLSAKSLKTSRIGLLFNGLFKIPMQFLILSIGVLVFVFYQFNPSPLHFNSYQTEQVKKSAFAGEWKQKENELAKLFQTKKELIASSSDVQSVRKEVKQLMQEEKTIRTDAKNILAKALPGTDFNDKDYVFLSFILNYMPHGIIGLLIAIVFFASMSSTASEVNALGTCSMIDFYKRLRNKEMSNKTELFISRFFNLFWGILAIVFALFFSHAENLIQGVNIIGSLFYGNILGIFLISFLVKEKLNGNFVFIAALITQAVILSIYLLDVEIGFLWFNFIACVLVMFLSFLLQGFAKILKIGN